MALVHYGLDFLGPAALTRSTTRSTLGWTDKLSPHTHTIHPGDSLYQSSSATRPHPSLVLLHPHAQATLSHHTQQASSKPEPTAIDPRPAGGVPPIQTDLNRTSPFPSSCAQPILDFTFRLDRTDLRPDETFEAGDTSHDRRLLAYELSAPHRLLRPRDTASALASNHPLALRSPAAGRKIPSRWHKRADTTTR